MANQFSSTKLFPLPAESITERHHNDVVKQHWSITFAHQKRMGVVAKRIMARVLDQIRGDDSSLRESYQVSVSDVINGVNIKRENIYHEIGEALQELSNAVWRFQDVGKDSWHIRHLLDTTKEKPSGYEKGVITVLLNPQLAPFFVKVLHHTSYNLDGYMKLRSWYSMRLYEILSAFRDTGFWEVGLDEYRSLMDCNTQKGKDGKPRLKYPNVNDLIKYTTDQPKEDLAGTDMAFRLEPRLEAERAGPGRRRIVRLRFDLLKPLVRTIPEAWLQHPETKACIDKLRFWKVREVNIVRYAEVITLKGINRLIHGWQKKENSEQRINNRESYCNAAFTKAAQNILDMQKAEALEVRSKPSNG